MQIYAKYFEDMQQSTLLSTGLRLVVEDDDQMCHLGTFDGDHLVSYVSLHNTGEYWQVDMQCTDHEYRGQGYVRKSIETAITKYGCVISDFAQTLEAQNTWKALIRRPNLFHYYWLNLDTHSQVKIRIENGQMIPNPWDETDSTVILACDRQLTESAMQRMSVRQKLDQQLGCRDRWLGPGFTEFNP